MARWIVGDSRAAVSWVSVAAGLLSLGFLFLAVGELLGCRRRAVGAVVLFAFFPGVWLHAGVPLSDPLGLAVAVAGWWLVLLARRRRWALTGATAAAAVSVRPQTAVVVALPLLHVAVALTKAEQRCRLPSGLLVGFVTVACAVVAAPGVTVDRRVLGLQVRDPRLEVLAGAGEAVAGDR